MSDIGDTLLLFFTRRTSGPARRMESVIAHIAHKERDRLVVLTVDADEHVDLTTRLGVEEIPSVVLVKEGRPVGSLSGKATSAQIERLLGAHLA